MEVCFMRICILMGSPRLHGNTAELVKPFVEELKKKGADVVSIPLDEKQIAPCRGCYVCQDVAGEYGCVQQDDMQKVAEEIVRADHLILATPIYSWYCTPKMKAVLDRCFGLNKVYRSAKGSLWEGKRVAILATHGYDRAYAAEPFETGIQRFCEHYYLQYEGMYSVRDVDDLPSFQTEEAKQGAREFADRLVGVSG